MALRKWIKNPDDQIRLGLVFLILASLSSWAFRRDPGLSGPWSDGVLGFLYGVAVGGILLGTWKKSRRGSAASGS